LHPAFALKLAAGIKALRDAGYSNAGINSAFRTGSGATGTGSRFDVAGESLHSLGAATDLGGIGSAGSAQAIKAHQILAGAGIYGPYGPYNSAEWNHFQLVPQKVVAGAPELVQKLGVAGSHLPNQAELEQLWKSTGVPFPTDTAVAKAGGSGGKMLFVQGIERVEGERVSEIEDQARRIAAARGEDFDIVRGNMSADDQEKLVRQRLAQGDITDVTGFSMGAYTLERLKRDQKFMAAHPNLKMTGIGGTKSGADPDFPGVKHLDLPGALAAREEAKAKATQTAAATPTPPEKPKTDSAATNPALASAKMAEGGLVLGPDSGAELDHFMGRDVRRILGKLIVDVNAPAGTSVDAEGGGIFKAIQLNRQTQMRNARAGPVI
jgi:hypothetical protein